MQRRTGEDPRLVRCVGAGQQADARAVHIAEQRVLAGEHLRAGGALRRIDRGAYGICEMSGKAIPQARLEAIPFARLTVECQAQWEKEYGNRRFRPSNEVGFAGGHYQDDEDSETVSLDEDDD